MLWNVYWECDGIKGQSVGLFLHERDWIIDNIKAQGGRILGIVQC